jgi:hypothetical protein
MLSSETLLLYLNKESNGLFTPDYYLIGEIGEESSKLSPWFCPYISSYSSRVKAAYYNCIEVLL